MRASFQIHKDNAKRRGKEWGLTFEQFEKFAVETKLLTAPGRSKNSFSIDRIDPEKGYTIDNIQVLTVSANTAKQHREKKLKKLEFDWRSGFARVISLGGGAMRGPFDMDKLGRLLF